MPHAPGRKASACVKLWPKRRADVKMPLHQVGIRTVDAPFTYAELQRALAGTDVGAGASELHGLLTGYLCGGGTVGGGDEVLRALHLESDDMAADAPLAALLEQAGPWCREQLDHADLLFAPLLPADALPLAERADAMVEWTRGFLGGFGLAGADAQRLSEQGQEVLRDLAHIAATQLTLDDSSGSAVEEDETALMELLEFVRVAAMLLRTDVAAGQRGAQAH